jgi:hypothetical protein
MSQTYFNLFKDIQYGNTTAIDIMERAVSSLNTNGNPYIFYPLDITNGARADQIANYNFKDPYASWVLYLTNNIIDPYYDWYLDDDQFNQFIVNKYGSIQQATQKVAYWTNNWVDQPSLSVSGYNAEIAGNPGRIKYWEPSTYNNYNQIIQYSRTQIDWKVDTNQTISYTLTSNAQFTIDEIVNIGTNGSGQVVQSNNNILVVQHLFFPQMSGNIVGQESGETAAIQSVNYQSINISADEFVYWTPIYYYDMERIKNEGNRTILVMQNNDVPSFINTVKQVLG